MEPKLARDWARDCEQLFFGGLIGALASALAARFLVLGFDVPLIVLVAVVGCGALGGVFVTYYGRGKDVVSERFQFWNDRIRQFSLTVMLWMLALAALIGVLTVLTASYDTLGRLAGTVVTTGIAAGLLWPLSKMADQSKTLAAGLLGMTAVLVVYMMIIPLLWDLDHSDEEMIISAVVIGLTAPFGMTFLVLKNLRPMWIAGRFGMAAWVAVLMLFLIATWVPGSYRQSIPWWETGWAVALYGSLGFASLAGLPRLALSWRWIGVATSFLGWTLAMIAIWGDSQDPGDLIVVITSVAVVFGHTALALLTPLKSGQAWILWGTVAAMVFGAVFLDLEVILDKAGSLSMYGRLAGAGGIVASCGSLALVILASLNRSKAPPPKTEFAEIDSIRLTCPQCGKQQTVPLSRASCEACGLKIHVEVQLPDSQEHLVDGADDD